MRRHEVSDETWEVIAPLLPGKKSDPGRTAKNNRKFVNAVFWLAKTGSPWRDLPERFGNWNSVFRRFRRWANNGVWERVLEAISEDEQYELLLLDSSIIRAHQHAAGGKKGAEHEALGRSRGGYGTKIHAAVNEHGTVVKLDLTGGERHDLCKANELIADCVAKHVVGDKGYDSDQFRAEIRRQRAKPAIPSRRSHRRRKCPKSIYRQRNIVERFFGRIKHFRRVSMRFDKTMESYLSWVCVASTLVTLK